MLVPVADSDTANPGSFFAVDRLVDPQPLNLSLTEVRRRRGSVLQMRYVVNVALWGLEAVKRQEHSIVLAAPFRRI